MRLRIDEITGINFDRNAQLQMLKGLNDSMMPPCYYEIEDYVNGASQELSVEAVQWIRRNERYFKNEVAIAQLSQNATDRN